MTNENLKLQIKELKKANEEWANLHLRVKKENGELENSNVEKEELLLFYRKTTLELKKEIEELKAMVNDLIPAKIVRKYQLCNEVGDIKEKNKLIEKQKFVNRWNK